MDQSSIQKILDKKQRGEKITVLTAYDYPMAALVDEAGIDIILVGDSLANVVLGLEETKSVTMNHMIYHCQAVRRAVKNAMVVGDMPFSGYQINPKAAAKNSQRFIQEAGCAAVKIEWFEHCLDVTRSIVKANIPVMGHIGLTPQTADQIGGLKVQAKEAKAAQALIENAQKLQDAGCFAIVLECIPAEIAQLITAKLNIPTIGIGAGPHCDGQVLVIHDILGLFPRHQPKFVKQYINLAPLISKAIGQFKEEVTKKYYPDFHQAFFTLRLSSTPSGP